MDEELRRKIMEYEEAMRVGNERAHRLEQFVTSHMNQGFGGVYEEEEDEEDN